MNFIVKEKKFDFQSLEGEFHILCGVNFRIPMDV